MVRLFVHVSKSTRAHFDLRHRVPRVRRPWGLRIRVLAAAGTIALVSAITFGLLLNALLDQQRAAGPARNVTEARNAINAIQRLSQDLETGARGFLLTEDRSFLDPYTAARRELPRQLAALAAVPNDAGQRARTAELRRELAAYTSYLEDVIGRADASAVTAQEGRRQFDAIRVTVTELDASERRELLQRRAQSADLRERSIVVAGIGLAVLLLLIGLISYGAVRGVVIPVDRLQGFARELGARRYGARLPESGPPETVELAQAFNATAVSLEAAEAELRRIGERHLAELDAVFAEAPLGLAFVDQELRYLRVNDALAEMNGLAAAALVGKRVRHAGRGRRARARARHGGARAQRRGGRRGTAVRGQLLPGPRRRRRPGRGRGGGVRRRGPPARGGRA